MAVLSFFIGSSLSYYSGYLLAETEYNNISYIIVIKSYWFSSFSLIIDGKIVVICCCFFTNCLFDV